MKYNGTVFFLLGLALVLVTVSTIFFFFNRRKASVCLIISLLYLGVAGYYAYLVLIFPPPAETLRSPAPESLSPVPASSPTHPQLVMKVNGQEILAEAGDELTIKKSATIELVRVNYSQSSQPLKANLVGFVANPRYNDGQDIGAQITYDKIDKARAVNRATNLFKVELKQGEKVLGNVYLQFVD